MIMSLKQREKIKPRIKWNNKIYMRQLERFLYDLEMKTREQNRLKQQAKGNRVI